MSTQVESASESPTAEDVSVRPEPRAERDGQSTPSAAAGGRTGLTLQCPLRGELKATAKRKDLLGPSEEKLRIDLIRHLLKLGYPKEHITTEAIVYRLGNAGRNSLRTDVVVYDIPASRAHLLPLEDRLLHAVILGEVKREHSSADRAKETQVKPLLGPAKAGARAVYWDDVEQRVYWHDSEKRTREAPLTALPPYGVKFKGVPELTSRDLVPPASVSDLFNRIDDVLHGDSVDRETRYTVLLQLLLAKLYDEMEHADDDDAMAIQDPVALNMDPEVTLERFNALLKKAAAYFGANLPKPIPASLPVKPMTLVHVLPLLADKDLTHVAPRLMQDFFMKFAKGLYKWDMAQYFTPVTISEFIVDIVNPGLAEMVKDPAQGSADFLLATHRRRVGKKQLRVTLFGSDDSETAIQVAELNKVVHGTTAVELTKEDSLEQVDAPSNVGEDGRGRYDVVICNPPFGTSITEKRPEVLEKFDLARDLKWNARNRRWSGSRLRKSQQKGILFLEACVRMTKPGGRVAIILPNGYLGNRGPQYVALRDWMLRHCRVAAIVSFPRFTFKQSGADVSASLVVLQKRSRPLDDVTQDDYPMAVEMVERPGWELGNKVGKPTWLRDESDGTEIVVEGSKVLDYDLDDVLSRLQSSAAAVEFPWLAGSSPRLDGQDVGWSVPISNIVADPTLTLDPKRHCRKFADTVASIKAVDHFRLGDVVEVVGQVTALEMAEGRDPSATYRYVEISDVGSGTYAWSDYRGWKLPDRARHVASPGDIFVGSIWGSVQKWFLAGGKTDDLVVTNGFHRLRMRPGKEDYLPDVLAGMCLEAWAIQMRGMARGSDGLAEVHESDLLEVVLPRVPAGTVRTELEAFAEQLSKGHTSIKAAVDDYAREGGLPVKGIEPRHSHVVLV